MIRSLFQAAIPKMHKQGQIISALGPFSVEFYEKFGFVNVESLIKYSFTNNNFREINHNPTQ